VGGIDYQDLTRQDVEEEHTGTYLWCVLVVCTSRPSFSLTAVILSESSDSQSATEPREHGTLLQDLTRQDVEEERTWMCLQRVLKQGTVLPGLPE
jgi:hypothetical protein